MKGLIIRQPWVDMILDGRKTWELRSRRTKISGPIAVIAKGTGTVVGVTEIVDMRGPFTVRALRKHEGQHCVPPGVIKALAYKQVIAWELRGSKRLSIPVRFTPRPGAVIWVNLSPAVSRKVIQAAGCAK
jgi:hypothetical protein